MFVVTPTTIQAGHKFIWGDWSFHLALVSNFTQRPVSLWFSSFPLYAGAKLNYPFAINLLSALLQKSNVPLQWAMLLPSIFCTETFVLLFVRQFSKLLTKKLALLSLTLFTFSGGLGFWIAGHGNWIEIWKYWWFGPEALTQLPDTQIVFTNIWLGMLVPQRAFLPGLIISLIVLPTLLRITFNKSAHLPWVLLCGALVGLLPIIHTHSFGVMGWFSVGFGVYWIVQAYRKKSLPPIRNWLAYGATALVVSACLWFFLLKPNVLPQQYLSWAPGWMSGTQNILSWLEFWWENWGFFLPLSLAGTYLLCRKKKELGLLAVLSWGLFILANLVRFQPVEWDNSKALAWVYLCVSPAAAYTLSSLWQLHIKNRVFGLMTVLLFSLCIISGGRDLARLMDKSLSTVVMFDQAGIKLAQYVQSTPPESIFLTGAYALNPVSSLGGRSVLLGFPLWVQNFGLAATEREQDIPKMYSGGKQAEYLLQKYQVTYVVIGPGEQNLHPNKAFFDANYSVVYQNSEHSEHGEYVVYKTQ